MLKDNDLEIDRLLRIASTVNLYIFAGAPITVLVAGAMQLLHLLLVILLHAQVIYNLSFLPLYLLPFPHLLLLILIPPPSSVNDL